MQKYSTILFVIGLIMLAGCGNDDTSLDKGETNEAQATQSEEAEDIQEEVEETEVEEVSSGESSDSLEVINAVAEAMNQVNGMALEGEIVSFVEMDGIVTVDETDEITGEVTLDPYTEHLNYQTTSNLGGGTEETEFYLVEQKTYAYFPSDGWIIAPMGPDHFGSILTESQYKTFSKHHDQFELSEKNGNYLLSFEGSGEIYKEVIYGSLKDTLGEEAYEAITDIVDGISGSFQFTVDKETFHVVSISHESEIPDEGMNMDVSVSFEYSKHNEIDDVVVPDDVIENAQTLPGMDSIEGE